MPYTVQGNLTTQRDLSALRSVSYDYDYPEGLNLKPGSKLHQSLRDKLIERIQLSSNEMEKRFDSWRAIDQTLTTYIPTDEAEELVKEADSRRPVSIVFPYSYAMLETLLAYLLGTFVQEPIWTYEARSPEDTIGALMLQNVIQYQAYRARMPINLHTWLRDGLAYGAGFVSPQWEEKTAPRIVKDVSSVEGISFDRRVIQSTVYEGNTLSNIDPYRALPDPTVAVHEVQKGEFFGWICRSNLMNLLGEEASGASNLFNVKYLKHMISKRSVYAEDKSDRQKRFGGPYTPDSVVLSPVDEIYMYVNLIPKDWGLGSEENPEKWLFGLAADEVVIRAQKLGLVHNLYPVAVNAPDFDGYSPIAFSRLEVLNGLQGVLDFLFNSHIANVRKAINDVIIYDPYLLNGKDLESPEPGKLVRMRRPAWGRGVKDAIMQLPITDITRGNIADSSWIVQWMQRIAIADDSMMGAMRQGGPERLTQGEFQGTRGGSLSRLGRVVNVIAWQGMTDLGYMLAMHTQQLMKQNTYVNIIGEWQQRLEQEYGVQGSRMKVTPWDILIDFDTIVRPEGTGAGNEQVMLQLFEMITRTPELAQGYDTFRVFSSIARKAGEKNIEEFRRKQPMQMQPKLMQDQRVQQQVQQGNLVPTQQVLDMMQGGGIQ